MKKYNLFFEYLKRNNIVFDTNPRTNETTINRNLLSYDLRKEANELGLNIFELDTLIVFF
jgi:hypothetical protein